MKIGSHNGWLGFNDVSVRRRPSPLTSLTVFPLILALQWGISCVVGNSVVIEPIFLEQK